MARIYLCITYLLICLLTNRSFLKHYPEYILIDRQTKLLTPYLQSHVPLSDITNLNCEHVTADVLDMFNYRSPFANE